MNAVPITLFWVLAMWGLMGRRTVLIYLFFATMPFGSFAVVPTELTGGLTFTPTPVIALLLTCRTLLSEAGLSFVMESALEIRRLGLLMAFWVVAIFTTIFMPRYFAWQIEIIPMRGLSGQSDLLQPTVQNISQLVYLTISVFAVVAFARLLQSPSMREHALKAMCLGAAMVVLTGVLDLATRWLPIVVYLEPFRTATYSLLTDVEVLDAKRIVGLMPEASSYGALSVGFLSSLYFFRRAMVPGRLQGVVVPVLMTLLLLFAWLSTSSAAYLGLAILAAAAGVEWLGRAAVASSNGSSRQGLIVEFWTAFAAFIAVLLIVLASPDLLDPITAMIERMAFEKAESQSFEERGMWTAVSLQAFFDTYGLGVGMGGTRASSAFVAILSNVGLLGAVLYYAFVTKSFIVRSHPQDAVGSAMAKASRYSLIPAMFMALIVGTTADFGLFNAFRFGILSAIANGCGMVASMMSNSTKNRYFLGI